MNLTELVVTDRGSIVNKYKKSVINETSREPSESDIN
jgi:hypothetical protein